LADFSERRFEISIDRLQITTSRFEIQICRFGIQIRRFGIQIRRFEIQIRRSGIQIRRFEIQICHFEIRICRFEIQIRRFEIQICRAEIQICRAEIQICRAGTPLKRRPIAKSLSEVSQHQCETVDRRALNDCSSRGPNDRCCHRFDLPAAPFSLLPQQGVHNATLSRSRGRDRSVGRAGSRRARASRGGLPHTARPRHRIADEAGHVRADARMSLQIGNSFPYCKA